MYRALAIKELRESAGLLALAVLAVGYALAELTGTPLLPGWRSEVNALPFVSDELWFYLWAIGGGLAILLGLKQTAWEAMRGTFQFLLHRPLPRANIFWFKIAFGLLVMQGLTAAWILLYALWAATPGNHDAPFYWSMTLKALRVWLCLPILYLGAFLSGLRPAHWFATRLAPLIAAALFFTVLVGPPWWWSLWIPLWAFILAAQFLAIFYYVRYRDY